MASPHAAHLNRRRRFETHQSKRNSRLFQRFRFGIAVDDGQRRTQAHQRPCGWKALPAHRGAY